MVNNSIHIIHIRINHNMQMINMEQIVISLTIAYILVIIQILVVNYIRQWERVWTIRQIIRLRLLHTTLNIIKIHRDKFNPVGPVIIMDINLIIILIHQPILNIIQILNNFHAMETITMDIIDCLIG